MEDDGSNINISSKSYPMTGGDGSYSYKKNSCLQRESLNFTKSIIDDEIIKKLNIDHLPLNNFRIADLGCSVGPNTFIAVQNIIKAVEFKYLSTGLNPEILEFQVFFNDQETNDFNTLFTSIPKDRKYFVAGVPGSFHGRLFPKASLHVVNSSIAVHWLSKVPKEVLDKSSPAWNKGKIHYLGASDKVIEAYSAQFARDMEAFFHARAQELVSGGLMTLTMPCLPTENPHAQCNASTLFDILTSCFMDLVTMGLCCEAKVDSFNIPVYFMCPQEMEEIIERNGYFSIERMEQLTQDVDAKLCLELCPLHMRAAMEGFISEHFGTEVIDELFNQFSEKLTEPSHASALIQPEGNQLVVVLKRK